MLLYGVYIQYLYFKYVVSIFNVTSQGGLGKGGGKTTQTLALGVTNVSLPRTKIHHKLAKNFDKQWNYCRATLQILSSRTLMTFHFRLLGAGRPKIFVKFINDEAKVQLTLFWKSFMMFYAFREGSLRLTISHKGRYVVTFICYFNDQFISLTRSRVYNNNNE